MQCVFAIWVALAVASVSSIAGASSHDDAEYARVFDAIMLDPGNPDLNLRYARMAAERGDWRKALAAYERILSQNPIHAEALANRRRVLLILEPTNTEATLTVGTSYATNPRHGLIAGPRTDDVYWTVRGSVLHERRIGALRWRFEADAGYTYHGTFRELDYGTFGARTGPLLEIGDGLRLSPFVGLTYAVLQQRSFFLEPALGMTFDTDRTGPLRSLTVRWGYQMMNDFFTTRDGVFVEFYPRFQFVHPAAPELTATVIPYWRYNGVFGSGPPTQNELAEPFPARQHQLGIRAELIRQALPNLFFGINATYEHRHMFEKVLGEAKNRRDDVIAPGAQVIATGLFGRPLDAVLSYTFEHRTSNDSLQRYVNHIVGLRLVARF